MLLNRRIFAVALATMLVLPGCASAQGTTPVSAATPPRLAVGTWTGTIITPGNQDADNITYEVAYNAGVLGITLVVGEHGSFPLNDIVVSDAGITFSFTPGPKVNCVLTAKAIGYAGECKDDDGNVVPLTMVPPAKEAKS